MGAALAPADAALGAGMMVNPAVPARIRRLINVESGVNDGIATPFVPVANSGVHRWDRFGRSCRRTGGGPGHRRGGGSARGWLVRLARRRGWAADGFAGPAVLGLAICTYASTLALHGNGFIAAFTGGLAYGAARAAWRSAGPARR